MAELPKLTPNPEWWEAPKDALSEVTRKLWITQDIIERINKLTLEYKNQCIISLEDILTELNNWKIWEADKNQKIRDTLASEYNIIINGNLPNKWSIQTSFTSINSEIDNTNTESNLGFKRLQERLENVKKLDEWLNTPVVSDELAKAKTKPLPPEAKAAIAKASNIPLEKLDASIQQWGNPQLSNFIDTYYLSQQDTINAIEAKLPEEKKNTLVFQELRASAREFWIPYTERADNVKALISNKSDATQAKVVETVWALTKGAPETLITRTGDKLTFNNPKDKESTYEIDIGQNPPRLRKIVGNLSITRELPDTNHQAIQWELLKKKDTLRTSIEQSSEKFKTLEAMSKDQGSETEKYLAELYSTDESIKTSREEIKKRIQEAKTPEASLAAFQDLLQSNTAIQIKSKDPNFLTVERASMPAAQLIGRMLGDEAVQIDNLVQKLESYIKTTKKIENTPKSNLMNLEDWEKSADKSLGVLKNTWYSFLWQDLTERLIDAINLKKWWKNTNNEIDLNQNPKLEEFQEDELVLWLARLTRVNNTMPTWNDVNPNDRFIAERQLTSWESGKNALIAVMKIYQSNEATRWFWSTSESLGNWLYQDTANQEKWKTDKQPNSALNTHIDNPPTIFS